MTPVTKFGIDLNARYDYETFFALNKKKKKFGGKRELITFNDICLIKLWQSQ